MLNFRSILAVGVVAYIDSAAAAWRGSLAARILASRDKNSDELVKKHFSENLNVADRNGKNVVRCILPMQ